MSLHATWPELPGATATDALAVVAHPDDESFGLGAILSALSGAGVTVRVLCLTHGEASTLGSTVNLAQVRACELQAAATVLGVCVVALLDYPDGGLADVPFDALNAEIEKRLGEADLLVLFEPRGVTGHPDHQTATAAATRVAARHGMSVLEWGVPPDVARRLNDELSTAFVAADGSDVEVDRTAQLVAIRCHSSQAHDNPVLRRRLALQGSRERLRLLDASAAGPVVTVHRSKGTFAPTPPGMAGRSVES
jgi:LmbE family N-acetylglucosaminyl deacetylase